MEVINGSTVTENYQTSRVAGTGSQGCVQALEISNTPVREALSLLKSEGLVVSELHKGYRVFTMNHEELVHFCELRFALESRALRYGVERDLSGLSKKP